MEKQIELCRFRKYLLFLVVSLSLLSCQEEELLSISSELELTEITSYQFNSLNEKAIQENSFLQKNLFNKNPIQRQAKSQDTYATHEIKLFGLSLQANLAQQISNDSIATYTFSLLDKDNFLEGKLANLVLVENKLSQESYTFFVTYNNWEEVSSGTSDMMEYSYRILTGDSSPKITDHHRATKSSNPCMDWEHLACLFTLDEVVITGPVRRTEPIYLSIAPSWDGGGDPLNDGSDFSPSLGGGGGGGGGGGSNGGSRESFPTIPIEPKPKTPCEKVKNTFNNSEVQKYLSGLYAKRKESIEYGFAKYKALPSSPYSQVVGGISQTGNSVKFSFPSSIAKRIEGIFHTHPFGTHPVFSPEDFLSFIQTISHSTDIAAEDNYVVVIAANGEGFMLTFEGTQADFNKMGNPLIFGGNDIANIDPNDIPSYDGYYDYLSNIKKLSQAEVFIQAMNTTYLKGELTLDSLGFRLTQLKFDNNGKLIGSENVSIDKDDNVKRNNCK